MLLDCTEIEVSKLSVLIKRSLPILIKIRYIASDDTKICLNKSMSVFCFELLVSFDHHITAAGTMQRDILTVKMSIGLNFVLTNFQFDMFVLFHRLKLRFKKLKCFKDFSKNDILSTVCYLLGFLFQLGFCYSS